MEATSKRHPEPKRALLLRGRDVLVQYVLGVSEHEKKLRARDMHGLEELVNHGLNEPALSQGASDRDRRALSSLA